MLRPTILMAAAMATYVAQAQGFEASVGQPVPKFTLTTITGQKITNKSLKGKVVLFDFWATWCGPCKAASPAMQRLAKDFGPKGLIVIGADVFEHSPGPAGAKGYSKAHGFSYTFTYDSDKLAGDLGISAIPAFALVGRDGVIKEAVTGVSRSGPDALYDFMAKKISPLLRKG